MTSCSELADIHWLTDNEARALLNELAENTAPLHTVIAKLRGQLSASRTHLLVEQTELRRRATAKFTHPEEMFFTRVGLEQSTDEWIAAYKATRVRVLPARRRPLLRHRRRPNRPHRPFPRHRPRPRPHLRPLRPHQRPDRGPLPTTSPHFDLADCDAWHIDPDRRPTGKRTTSLDHCAPTAPPSSRCSLATQTPPSNSPPPPNCRPSGSTAASSNGSAATANANNSSPGTAISRELLGQHRATILHPFPDRLRFSSTNNHGPTQSSHPNRNSTQPLHLRRRPRRPRRPPHRRSRLPNTSLSALDHGPNLPHRPRANRRPRPRLLRSPRTPPIPHPRTRPSLARLQHRPTRNQKTRRRHHPRNAPPQPKTPRPQRRHAPPHQNRRPPHRHPGKPHHLGGFSTPPNSAKIRD